MSSKRASSSVSDSGQFPGHNPDNNGAVEPCRRAGERACSDRGGIPCSAGSGIARRYCTVTLGIERDRCCGGIYQAAARHTVAGRCRRAGFAGDRQGPVAVVADLRYKPRVRACHSRNSVSAVSGNIWRTIQP